MLVLNSVHSPMDELLLKLRSQATGTQRRSQKESTQIERDGECIKPTQVTDGEDDTSASLDKKEPFEITTSQSENLSQNRFKLDFDILKKYRVGRVVSVVEVKESELFKMDGPLWGIVKSIEVFKGVKDSVYKWEICDETGVIFGSSIVGDSIVTVGSIVCLINFSLWKVGENHLNIVERNIKTVI